MKRRMVTAFVMRAVLPLVCILVACCSQREIERGERRDSIRIGYNASSLNYGPVMVALELGMFAESERGFELVAVESGREVGHGVAAGRFEAGFASAADFLVPISAGAPLKIIAPLTLTKTLLFVRPDGEVQTFADLRGKRVRGGRGGHSEFVFRMALRKEGIDESEIEFVPVEHAFRGVALLYKKVIDAVPMSVYGTVDLAEQGAIVHREWLDKGYADRLWLNAVIAARTRFVQENADALEGILNVIISARNFMAANREEAAALVSRCVQKETAGIKVYGTNEILQLWDGDIEYVLWSDPAVLIEESNSLFETAMIKRKVSLEEAYDCRFEAKLKSVQASDHEKQD